MSNQLKCETDDMKETVVQPNFKNIEDFTLGNKIRQNGIRYIIREIYWEKKLVLVQSCSTGSTVCFEFGSKFIMAGD